MGNATVICSDKTGTLTQNKMTVVTGTLGKDDSFDRISEQNDEGSSPARDMLTSMSEATRDLLIKGIALNSTAFEGEENGQRTYIGSKTEVAMLQLIENYFGLNLAEERANSDTIQLFPFDSARKCMGIVVRQADGVYRLHVKGAAEIMLAQATSVIGRLSEPKFDVEKLSGQSKDDILERINSYSSRSLRTIGMAYKDFESWPPQGAKTMEDDKSAAEFESIFRDMVWVGIVGIQDPLRPEVPGAIEKCNRAGVQVKMVTG